MVKFRTLVAAALLAAPAAWAQHAKVEAVQYPAWLERGGQVVPLTPGTTLQSSDTVKTGDNARVQLRLSEGSTVKLGERAQFQIERAQDRGIFEATLSVIAGAFRFTGQALGKKRDISIKVKNATAGIRGTDLWGKATDDRDIVCLIEGRITVGSEGHPTVVMDQPLDFYQKPRGAAPAVAKVDAKQIEVWAQETEIAADAGAARTTGRWRVVAGLYSSRDNALKLNRMLRASGYPSSIQARQPNFAVVIGGLAGEVQARALMANLRRLPGVELPKVEEGPPPGT
jgi:hypothetical protein